MQRAGDQSSRDSMRLSGFVRLLLIVMVPALLLGRTIGDWAADISTSFAWQLLPWLLLILFWGVVIGRARRDNNGGTPRV